MNAAVGTYCIYQNPGVWPKVKTETHISGQRAFQCLELTSRCQKQSGAAWPNPPGASYSLPVSPLAQEKVTSFTGEVDGSASVTSFIPFPLLGGQKLLQAPRSLIRKLKNSTKKKKAIVEVSKNEIHPSSFNEKNKLPLICEYSFSSAFNCFCISVFCIDTNLITYH